MFSIAVAAIVIYVAALFGRPWFRYQEFRSEFKSAARFAQTLTDSTILVRLQAQADSLGLPRQARRIMIRRLGNPPRITITAKYQETVTVPFIGTKILEFNPAIEAETQ